MVLTTVPQADYDKSMTTRKNVRGGALGPLQKADLRSLRLAFIATLRHGKETHGLASAMTLIDASIRAQRSELSMARTRSRRRREDRPA
jgi:hypothetical protein